MVGLAPGKEGKDIRAFDMARARLPDEVFRQIMLDLDAFSLQYGSTAEHRNEEARSRFLSAVSSFTLSSSEQNIFAHVNHT